MSNLIMPSRRLFLGGLIAAPAIIAADRLMPVKLFSTSDVVSDNWLLVNHKIMSNNFAWVSHNAIDNSLFQEYNVVRRERLAVRSNYKKFHAGTELLQIKNAAIIA